MTKQEQWDLRDACDVAGGDMGRVIEEFILDPSQFYERDGWPISALKRDVSKFYKLVKQKGKNAKERSKQEEEHERAKRASLEAYEREQGIRP